MTLHSHSWAQIQRNRSVQLPQFTAAGVEAAPVPISRGVGERRRAG